MKKVLQIGIGENYGGIEKLELEYMKHLSSDYKIDILAPNKKPFKHCNNSNIYDLNIPKFTRKNEILYDYRLFKFLKNNKYDIVHINSEIFFFSFRVILIAKLCGVKNIVMHSHGYIKNGFAKTLLINMLNPLFRKLINKYLACSTLAEKSLYTQSFIRKNKIIVLKNGISINDFIFNENIRNEYRKELNLDEKIIYGHVGRFSEAKNHKYLIDLFYNIQKIQNNSVLLLIGEGPLEKEIQEKINQLKINDKVLFLNYRDDVNKLLNVMDFFLFPSLNEGLGMAVIESQTNGLITFCSDNIPIEAKISDRLNYFNLNDDIHEITKKICNTKYDLLSRKDAYTKTIESGYDIKKVCKQLEEIYDSLF